MLCTAAVIGAFVTFLAPEGSLKKAVNTIVSLVMLAVVIFPIAGDRVFAIDEIDELDKNIGPADFYNEEYSNKMNEYILNSSEEVVRTQIDGILKEICDGEYRVNADLNINADGEVAIDSVTVEIDKTDAPKTAVIKAKTASLTGVVPEVKIK